MSGIIQILEETSRISEEFRMPDVTSMARWEVSSLTTK